MTWDFKLFYFFNNFAGQNPVVDFLVIFFAEYLQYVLLVGFLFLLFFSPAIRQEKLRIFFVTAISIVVARLGVTELIRFLYHRPRPYVSHEVYQLIAEQGWSFPSGHSAFFFAMAGAIFLFNKKWGIIFFLASLLMNISRVVSGVHYPVDILGGMAVGITVAWFVYYGAEKTGAGKALRGVEK